MMPKAELPAISIRLQQDRPPHPPSHSYQGIGGLQRSCCRKCCLYKYTR